MGMAIEGILGWLPSSQGPPFSWELLYIEVAPEALLVLYDPDSEPTTTPSKHLTKLNQSESFSGIFFFFQLGTRDTPLLMVGCRMWVLRTLWLFPSSLQRKSLHGRWQTTPISYTGTPSLLPHPFSERDRFDHNYRQGSSVTLFRKVEREHYGSVFWCMYFFFSFGFREKAIHSFPTFSSRRVLTSRYQA